MTEEQFSAAATKTLQLEEAVDWMAETLEHYLRIPGPPGPKGDAPSKEELKSLIKSVIAENPDRFRGERGPTGREGPIGPAGLPGEKGESIVGPPGPAGRDGMTRDEVANLIIEILRDIGVQTELGNKLIRLRSQIQAWEKQADSRHLAMVTQMVRKADAMFEDFTAFSTREEIQKLVIETLRAEQAKVPPSLPPPLVRMGWLKRILGW